KARFRSGEAQQCVAREIIQVLRHDVAVARSEQAHRQRARIGHENEAMSAGPKHRSGLGQKSARLVKMFKDRPKRDGVKTLRSKIVLRKWSRLDRDALLRCIIERWSGNIHSEHIVSRSGNRFETMEKGAGRTADIE